jgi:hypothetical protein
MLKDTIAQHPVKSTAGTKQQVCLNIFEFATIHLKCHVWRNRGETVRSLKEISFLP